MESQKPIQKQTTSSYPITGDELTPEKKVPTFAGLNCSICKDVTKSVYVFECEHFLCYPCLSDLFKKADPNKFKCVNCRRFHSDRDRRNVYNDLIEKGYNLSYKLFLTERESEALNTRQFSRDLVKKWKQNPDQIDLRVKSELNESLLHLSLYSNKDYLSIQELVKSISVDETDFMGQTPLMVSLNICMKPTLYFSNALKYNENVTALIRIAKLFLQQGADPNPESEPPLLHMAAGYGDHELVENFLYCGADVSKLDAKGQTALHWANTPQIAKKLLEQVDHLNTVDNDGLTPWAASVINQKIATARFLQLQGAAIGPYTSQGEDVLSRSIVAEFAGGKEVLESRSKNESRVHYLTNLPKWHQHFDVPAAMKKCIDNKLPDILKIIVSAATNAGCPVSSWCDQHHLLNLAVKKNKYHMTSCLLKIGASPYVQDTDDLNCFELARNNGYNLIEHVLNQASNSHERERSCSLSLSDESSITDTPFENIPADKPVAPDQTASHR